MGVKFSDLAEFGITEETGLIHYSAIETMDTELDLSHYGVLGMKWGVRRTQAQLDRAAGRRGGTRGSSAKGPRESAKSEASKLSDADLKASVNRMQMEKTYTELKAGPAPKKGKSITDRILDQSKDKLAKSIVDTGANVIGQALRDRKKSKNS